ncbi:MAG: hypothetical protein ACRDNW_24375 [Trebonia sp.]
MLAAQAARALEGVGETPFDRPQDLDPLADLGQLGSNQSRFRSGSALGYRTRKITNTDQSAA